MIVGGARGCKLIGKESRLPISLETYLVDGVAIDFADIVGPRRRFLDHFEGYRGEHAVLPPLSAKIAALAILHVAAMFVMVAATHMGSRMQKTLIVACKLDERKCGQSYQRLTERCRLAPMRSRDLHSPLGLFRLRLRLGNLTIITQWTRLPFYQARLISG